LENIGQERVFLAGLLTQLDGVTPDRLRLKALGADAQDRPEASRPGERCCAFE